MTMGFLRDLDEKGIRSAIKVEFFRSRTFRDLLVISIAVLAATIPFSGRGLFIDDHAVYDVAVRERPSFFNIYDYSDSGQPQTGWDGITTPNEYNPFVYFFVVSLADKAFGGRIWAIHILFAFFALIGCVAFYFLAREFIKGPLWASLLFAFSPCFLVTANALLADSLLSTFFVGGLCLFFPGFKSENKLLLLSAAVVAGLTPMVKYNGYLAWILIVLWILLKKRLDFFLNYYWFFLIALIPSMGWYVWNKIFYGASHMGGVMNAVISLPGWQTVFMAVLFVCGTAPFVIFSPAIIRLKSLMASFFLWLPLFLFMISPWGGFKPITSIIASMLVCSAAGFSYALWKQKKIFQDAKFTYLLSWVVLGFFSLIFQLEWVAGRYVVVLLPAAVLLFCALWENFCFGRGKLLVRVKYITVLPVLFFGLLCASADYSQAKADQKFAEKISGIEYFKYFGDKFYSQHAFSALGNYISPHGWRPYLDVEELTPGSLVVLQERTMSARFQRYPKEKSKLVDIIEIPALHRFRLVDIPSEACFYGSIWGFLPFTVVNRSYWEKYYILQIL